MRRSLHVLVLVVGLQAGAAGQDPLPVEDLLVRTTRQLEAMRKDFDQAFEAAVRVFLKTTTDSLESRQARRELAPWVGVFPDAFVERIKKPGGFVVKEALLRLVAESREPRIADKLAPLLERKDDNIKPYVVWCLGKLGSPAVAPQVHALLTRGGAPAVMSQCLISLAQLGHPDAVDLATKRLADPEPPIRRGAVLALTYAAPGQKDVAAGLLARIEEEKDASVLATLIRALGVFPGFAVQKRLHELTESADVTTLEATLDALAKVGKKDVSRPYLLKIIDRETLPERIRRRAAVTLLDWGDSAGVKSLLKREREWAEKNPRDADIQRSTGDAFRDIGAWHDALGYYARALNLSNRREQPRIRVSMARCYARLGKFSEAKRKMKEANYVSLARFADDEDFAKMKAHPKYKSLFQ